MCTNQQNEGQRTQKMQQAYVSPPTRQLVPPHVIATLSPATWETSAAAKKTMMPEHHKPAVVSLRRAR